MATFTHTPSYSSTVKKSAAIKETSFGDGYQQAMYSGIHEQYRVYSLSFNLITQTVADEITSFFDDNKTAIQSFDWTQPGGTAGKFKCKEYNTSFVYGEIVNLTCEFTEVFY